MPLIHIHHESEQVFFLTPLVVTPDERHSRAEPRFRALGRTLLGRRLAIIFTVRGDGTLIRVIAARDTKSMRAVFPNLKPSTQTISLRLPAHLLDAIKAAANCLNLTVDPRRKKLVAGGPVLSLDGRTWIQAACKRSAQARIVSPNA